jgi:hypothetical protein
VGRAPRTPRDARPQRYEIVDFILHSGQFATAYDEGDAKPYRWTYDGTPLKAA